jgi:type VI secretion system secreted protein Hcp
MPASSTTSSSTSMYLNIDGIPGDSTPGTHGSIQVLSYSHSVTQPVVKLASVGGGASGESIHGDFTITKNLDSSSPLIVAKCSRGDTVKSVVLTLVRAGGEGVPYMVFTLENVIITNVSPSGASSEDWPTESVSFNYERIMWEFTTQKRADGTGGGKTTGSWSVSKRRA